MSTELDGEYLVTSISSYEGPLDQRKSDGVTRIVNGRTERIDGDNVLWTSTFNIISENEVEMISIADPKQAPLDFALTRPDGVPTRQPVTYTTILKLARKGEKIQMSGRIEYGNDVILLTMRKNG